MRQKVISKSWLTTVFGLFALQVCCTWYVGICLNNVYSVASIVSGFILFCCCVFVRIFFNLWHRSPKQSHDKTWTIFCILKITSFHTSHNNFKTLPLPSKLQKKNNKKGCLKYLNHCFFRPILLLLFFRNSQAGNRLRRIPAVSRIKLKFMKHALQNAPLLEQRGLILPAKGRGALITSFQVGWFATWQTIPVTTICDLPTVKQRDWTRHEHYNMLYMWRIHFWV